MCVGVLFVLLIIKIWFIFIVFINGEFLYIMILFLIVGCKVRV